MGVWITGDTHGDIDIHKLNSTNFPEGLNLTKDDYVIICGDFGLVWNNDKSEIYWRKWLDDKPWTTLFVDGNHEAIPLIYEYPEVEFLGGKTHKITDSIYHLMRGEIFNICGKTFAVMGGAKSIDKLQRIEYISWWKEELPNRAEYENLLCNMEKINYKVDYMLTHTCPQRIKYKLATYKHDFRDEIEVFFDGLDNDLTFKRWYFGHHHVDLTIDDKYTCLYQNVIKVI